MRSKKEGGVKARARKDGRAMIDNKDFRVTAMEDDGKDYNATRLSLRMAALRLAMVGPWQRPVSGRTTVLCLKLDMSRHCQKACMSLSS